MIGIVILNYINWGVTEKCIQSIFATTSKVNYHIYLVDNASPNPAPNSISELLKNRNITFIKNKLNTGYSAGNNLGIKKALEEGCEVILIANSDIIFLENSILSMYGYLKSNPQVGIVGPKLFNLDGSAETPSMCIKTGIKEKYLVRTGLRKIFKSVSKKYNCLDRDIDKPFSVHAVSGSCFMMSRKCALDITPFDENTFLFEEELIIGIKMEQKGYKTVYYPQSAVIHAHGQSTKNIKAFSFICFVESEIYYCKKYLNAKTIQILPLYFIRTISYFMRAIKHKDFRKNIPTYFKSSWPRLFMKF
jgi:GT2 family glycosyltransferase